jgi:serine/threonine protein kinase
LHDEALPVLWCSKVDDYRVKKRLGQGSFGEVFLGYNMKTFEQVVIKVYKFNKLKMPRMLHEIRINQNLCHPNIAKLLHVVKQERTAYPALIFEYISDQTLDHVMQGVSASLTKLYAVQLLRGLAHAHERGVVHHDVKPSNVVVDARTDWGLSGIFREGNREFIVAL